MMDLSKKEGYKIVESGKEGMAKTCHSCKKITLGLDFEGLLPVEKEIVIFHEIGHEKGCKSEFQADCYAIKKMMEKGYKPRYILELLMQFRNDSEKSELKNLLNKMENE